jgi:uncharacterized protein YegJ (DUF2314 family)
MLKLLLHILVAIGIWFILSLFGLHWAFKVLAVFVGFVLVHILWERFLFNPYLYLGARHVSNDDPLMIEAAAKAKETLPKFLVIYPAHRNNSMVKFCFQTDGGMMENLWGDLLEIDDDKAKIYIRTPPVSHQGVLDRTMIIKLDNILDWQVEFEDGTLRGGFTARALFKIYEREEGRMHPKFMEQLRRFKEVDW